MGLEHGYTPPKFNIDPGNAGWKIGRLLSYWKGTLSGAMSNFRWVNGFINSR